LPLSAPGGPGGLSNHPSTVSLTSVTSVQPYDPALAAAEPPKPMPSDVLRLLPVEVFVHAGRLLLGGDRAAEAYEVPAHPRRPLPRRAPSPLPHAAPSPALCVVRCWPTAPACTRPPRCFRCLSNLRLPCSLPISPTPSLFRT